MTFEGKKGFGGYNFSTDDSLVGRIALETTGEPPHPYLRTLIGSQGGGKVGFEHFITDGSPVDLLKMMTDERERKQIIRRAIRLYDGR